MGSFEPLPEDRSVAAFLTQVHRQVVPVGPREMLAVERLLRSREERWGEGELRAALASVLARSEEQWGQVAGLYDAFAAGEAVLPEAGEKSAGQRPAVRRRFLLAALAILLMTASGWAWNRRLRPLPVPSLPEVHTLEWVIIGPLAEDLQKFELVPRSQEGTAVPVGTRRSPPKEEWEVLLLLAVLSAVLLALGSRLLRLGPAVRERCSQESVERRRRADRKREELEEQKAAAGRRLEIRYRVERFLPVSRQAVLDSAEWLGRLLREEHGIDLDAEATLDRTVAAGGQFSPVQALRHSRQEVLVLVDVEEGSHPWLEAFRRLQEAWTSQGILLRCYEFHMTPDSLVDAATRLPVTIEELARHMEGLPMILFSRRLSPTARQGTPRWLGCLEAWKRRAWLDPDPRRPEDFEPVRRRVLLAFGRLGLPRFYLSDEGVVLLARWLADGGEGKVVGLEAPLPPLPPAAEAGAGGPLAEALRKWALVAALVPDPTWDQLEAIRRHFPELHRELPEPRHVQRLLEWVERETQASAELEGGRGLAISEEMQHRWQVAQRRVEAEVPGEAGFEAKARQLLWLQLGTTPPEDELDRQWWKFKRSMHRAVLEPQRAVELLAWLYDAAIAHEAVRWVEGELERQAGEATERFSAAAVAELRERGGRLVGVPLGAMLFGYRVVWQRAARLGAVGALGLFLLSLVVGEPLAGRFEKEVIVAVPVTPVFELVDRSVGSNPVRGVFRMGSDRGDFDELPVHGVEVTSFQMSKTEVTVAQYGACVDAGQCKELDAGGDCNWGKAGRGDHPINCVSWDDARSYAAWVGARLPSEAEWEYAARSGGLEHEYPWGDELADCSRAIVRATEGAGCGQSGTWSVCSKSAGNTEQGLCDMAGNLWEWVEDDWHDNYVGAPEAGQAWIDAPRASYRVFRGGSWWNVPRYARVASRYGVEPFRHYDFVGFRVARSLPSAL